jgi:hypothetical protein
MCEPMYKIGEGASLVCSQSNMLYVRWRTRHCKSSEASEEASRICSQSNMQYVR